MLAAIAEGDSRLTNFSSSADCGATLACMRRLGVPIEQDGSTVLVAGVGMNGLQPPTAALDCENSGSTIRMLAGILAGQAFEFGDELALAPQRGEPVVPVRAKVGEAGFGIGQQVPSDDQQ